MPHGVCGRHPDHHSGPGGSPDGGGPGSDGVWMANTGRSGNIATSWLVREPPGGVAPFTLGGVTILLSREFKQLGVGQCLAAEKGTGPVLRGSLHKGLAIRCTPTFLMREVAQTLVQAVLECPDPPPPTGPVGRALQAAHHQGWQQREGWWH